MVTVDGAVPSNREYNYRNGFEVPIHFNARNVTDVLTRPRWLAGVFLRQVLTHGMPRFENYPPEVVHEVLKPKAAAQMRAALEKVVLPGGTATRAASPGFRSAGKTGTVQKHNPKGGYLPNSYIVSFAGMMPAQDPAFVCVVVIDDPRTQKVSRYGGTIAAPVFSKIATRVASHMNLQPTEPISPPLATAAR